MIHPGERNRLARVCVRVCVCMRVRTTTKAKLYSPVEAKND